MAQFDKEEVSVRYDEKGRLVLTLGANRTFAGVVPVRCFPLSAPSEWISFVDENGQEVFLLETLEDLEEDTRKLIVEDLRRREFLPRITRILRIEPSSEPSLWVVETDKGKMEFVLSTEDDVRQIDQKTLLITDSKGMRFIIRDADKLDRKSKKAIRRFL
jgi:hypothetical protein